MKKVVVWLLAALLLVAAGSAGAYFTAQTKVADNVVTAGEMTLAAEPASAALSIDGLAPGASVTKPLTVANNGSMPLGVVMTATKTAGITDFWNALTCRVACDGVSLYDGPISALRTTPLTVQPNTRPVLQVTIGLPEAAGNDLAGDYVKFTAYIDAEQVR